MQILNLYSGVGGNRKLWSNDHHITAVEYDPQISAAYADLYPNDTVITADAHQYLLDHHQNYDFIWSSPPCPTHSRMRYNLGVRAKGFPMQYPDMQLYEEILLLQHHYNGLWVVENVLPWYPPLIPATQINRHLYWSNFHIPPTAKQVEQLRKAQIPDLQKLHNIDLSKYPIPNKRQLLRNMVPPHIGQHILKAALTP